MTISGRSKNFNIDRFILVHESENMGAVQRDNPDESKSGSGLGSTAGFKARPKRVLTNSAGKKIEAELLGKSGDQVSILVNGKRYNIPVGSLSEADQEFIRDWQP